MWVVYAHYRETQLYEHARQAIFVNNVRNRKEYENKQRSQYVVNKIFYEQSVLRAYRNIHMPSIQYIYFI